MPTRRERLESLLDKSPTDPFLLYGLAVELLKTGDAVEGVERLRALTQSHPDYHAAHFQLGQTLAQQGESDEAKRWLEIGVAAATKVGDRKAAREMADFAETL
jgi:predicted Zn-dependent protease